MQQRFSNEELNAIRNRIPVSKVICEVLQIPNKEQEGFLRFLCPCCSEFRTAVHPTENLGRCFLCERNFNPIELVMAEKKLRFVESVKLLKPYLQ
jgi:hypothetical protein